MYHLIARIQKDIALPSILNELLINNKKRIYEMFYILLQNSFFVILHHQFYISRKTCCFRPQKGYISKPSKNTVIWKSKTNGKTST